MFYKNLDQTLLFIFFIVAAIFHLVSLVYQDKKEKEYHDDNRWRLIKLKSQSVIISYIEVVMVVLGVLFVGLPITFGIRIPISVERLSLITFNLLLLKSAIKYFSLKYFDKHCESIKSKEQLPKKIK
ncbi:MAG: hypothetical protein LBV67_02790 [Streptococcaceae bacterium]|jgi:uncharacterized membrane protein|nr:hypothetical protein [Streptococcaceae bacterium]